MPKVPLNPFLSRNPDESLEMIADGLKLADTCLAAAGADDMMLGYDELKGLSHLTAALWQALRYEIERCPELRSGHSGAVRATKAAGAE